MTRRPPVEADIEAVFEFVERATEPFTSRDVTRAVRSHRFDIAATTLLLMEKLGMVQRTGRRSDQHARLIVWERVDVAAPAALISAAAS